MPFRLCHSHYASNPSTLRLGFFGSRKLAAGVTGAGVLPGPVAPVTSAAPVACSSECARSGCGTPAGAASVTGLPGRHERARGLPAQRGARLVGRGPIRMGNLARVSPLPLLTLPIWFVCLPFLLLHLRMQMRGLVRCLLPTLDVLAWVVVALRVTAQRLTVTALLSLALRDWVQVRGQQQALTGLTWSMVIDLLPLLRVWRMTTILVHVPSTRSIWIRMTHLGLCFASSGISIVWRNRQV